MQPSRKAIVGMSVLGVLSIPAAAITAATTCTGIAIAARGYGALSGVPLGFLIAVAIAFGGLLLGNTSRLSACQAISLLGEVAKWQLLAVPFAILVGIVGFVAVYMHFAGRNRGEGSEVAMFLISIVVYSISAVSVFVVWRYWGDRNR